MLRLLFRCLDRAAEIDAATDFDGAVLRERIAALRSQLPWLYAIMSVNVAGVALVARSQTRYSLLPALLMLMFIAWRATHWVRLPVTRLPERSVPLQLRQTIIVTALFFAANAWWSARLYLNVGTARVDIAMIASLAAVGAACGLSSFPAAARIPLLFLAVPFGVAVGVSGHGAHASIGICIIILALINLRLLSIRDATLKRLIASRFSIEAEKKRAVEAEQLALREKRQVSSLANTDPLTGLANRRGLMAVVDQLGAADRRKFAVILLDLDGFKPINDTFGHAAGDAILVEVGRRLRLLTRECDTVARMGGDEFAILAEGRHAVHAIALAERAIASLARPFDFFGREMRISACAGISRDGGEDITEGLRRADIALFDAKRRGRGAVSLFTRKMGDEVQRRTAIEQALRGPGLLHNIELAFQPIFNLDTMRLDSLEALARWRHQDLGWISPAEFIPITEQISIVHQISDELLRRAARAAHGWPSEVRLSFNLSAVELCSEGTGARILAAIDNEGLSPERLQIEVTETAFLTDFALARDNLSTMRRSGIRIVLDDFGAGYSSIAYLREMNFDVVKLDGSLVSSIDSSVDAVPLLEGVLSLCRALGKECVAEHIESARHIEILQSLGCRFGQGYALSPPLGPREAEALAAVGAPIAQGGLTSRSGPRLVANSR